MNTAALEDSTGPIDTATGQTNRSRRRGAVARKLARGFEHVGKRARLIVGMIFDPALSRSYWPEESRKSKARVLMELLWGVLRHREWNGYYFVCGLDRKHGARTRDVIALRTVRKMRNRRNLVIPQGGPYNYVCILRDKFLFAQLLKSFGFSTPRTLALLDRHSVTWLESGERLPLESLAEQVATFDGFCKKLDGSQGEGAFTLRLGDRRIIADGVPIAVDELRNWLVGRFLLQERIQQHPIMTTLNPTSVNTVRLITYCVNGNATLFSAALRIGSAAKSVDNWAAGGLIVAIDRATGKLCGDGFFKPGYGGRTCVHPDSRIRLPGFQIPHFHEAVQLVTRLHEYLHQIHSIGWDVAISTHGPTIVEGNDDWEGGIPMVLERDFKRKFLGMY